MHEIVFREALNTQGYRAPVTVECATPVRQTRAMSDTLLRIFP